MKKSELRQVIKEVITELQGYDVDFDYVDELHKFVMKKLKGKKIEGWEFDYDKMSGTFEFTSPTKWVLLATPLWDAQAVLPFNLTDETGKDFWNHEVKFIPSKNIQKDFTTYFKWMKKILGDLNKRIVSGVIKK